MICADSSQACRDLTGQLLSLTVGNASAAAVTLLVGLGVAQRDTRPALENSRSATSSATCSERRTAPAEGAGTAEQQQGTILESDSCAWQFCQHALEIADDGRRLRRLSGADPAPNACMSTPYQWRRSRRGQVGCFVGQRVPALGVNDVAQ